MIEIITKINSAVNNFVWGPVMLLLLVGTGVYLTARTGCIQAAKFGYIMRNTVGSLFRRREKRDKDAKNLTPLSGSDHCSGRHRGHWQHRRCHRGYLRRRAGGGVLDVVRGFLWDVHQICGDRTGPEVPAG